MGNHIIQHYKLHTNHPQTLLRTEQRKARAIFNVHYLIYVLHKPQDQDRAQGWVPMEEAGINILEITLRDHRLQDRDGSLHLDNGVHRRHRRKSIIIIHIWVDRGYQVDSLSSLVIRELVDGMCSGQEAA